MSERKRKETPSVVYYGGQTCASPACKFGAYYRVGDRCFCGVHSDPNSGHSLGRISPRNTLPHSQPAGCS